jgi:outer membrane lipoprotein SlyB
VPTYVTEGNPAQLAPAPVATPAPEPRRVCTNCGTVSSISPIEKQGQGSGAGAVLGGLLGGVVGHQVGGGRGRDVATVAGAVGGALVGNEVEKSNKKTVSYDVRVHMENGSYRTLRYAAEPGYRVGDKVRIENGRLAPG